MSSDWRKSSYSGGNTGSCVEVATADTVLIRDTTNRGGFTLSVPAATWQAFLSGIRVSLPNRPTAPETASTNGRRTRFSAACT